MMVMVVKGPVLKGYSESSCVRDASNAEALGAAGDRVPNFLVKASDKSAPDLKHTLVKTRRKLANLRRAKTFSIYVGRCYIMIFIRRLSKTR